MEPMAPAATTGSATAMPRIRATHGSGSPTGVGPLAKRSIDPAMTCEPPSPVPPSRGVVRASASMAIPNAIPQAAPQIMVRASTGSGVSSYTSTE